jgi:hypothetical protein
MVPLAVGPEGIEDPLGQRGLDRLASRGLADRSHLGGGPGGPGLASRTRRTCARTCPTQAVRLLGGGEHRLSAVFTDSGPGGPGPTVAGLARRLRVPVRPAAEVAPGARRLAPGPRNGPAAQRALPVYRRRRGPRGAGFGLIQPAPGSAAWLRRDELTQALEIFHDGLYAGDHHAPDYALGARW